MDWTVLQADLENASRQILTLEINTIVRDEILGTKMDNPERALMDISIWYTTKLNSIARQMLNDPRCPLDAPARGKDPFRDFNATASGLVDKALFETIHGRAKALFVAASDWGVSPEGSGQLMLCRIQEKCGQVEQLLAARTPKSDQPPSGTQLMLLRKIWEVGTEEIAIQTVIQIDGDVITRVQAAHAGPDAPMLALHHDAVRTAVDFWSGLVSLVITTVQRIVGLAKG